MSYNYTVVDRFIRYAKIDTQSDPHSTSIPSTEKQKDLARVLLQELKDLGIEDVELDAFGYVYATVPANTDKHVPVICWCSHMDTSPESSGKDVKPIIHKNYDGEPMHLPNNDIVLDPEAHPDLKAQVGNDIITADGTTLLGADNKAGLAEIMDAVHFLTTHPKVKHGKIRILFTPDEEIGRGADKVDIEKLGADFGYTVDGETLGSIEDETFSADAAIVTIEGVNTHPGFAKDKMENALRIASDFIAALPKNAWSPETTSGREGFVHPYEMTAGAEKAEITFIVRSFVDEDLKKYAQRLEAILASVLENYPNSTGGVATTEQYRNMKNVLNKYPEVAANAEEAIRRAGIEVKKGSIRGGTDGSKLSFMGLPCPNIYAGEHAFHSKYEWASVYDMKRAVDTLVNLAQIWEENA